jgi:sugar lactone lactonase YvrE
MEDRHRAGAAGGRRRRGRRLLALTAILAAAWPAGAQAQPELDVVARGLDSPRGLAIGPNGALWVTEAGRGGAGPCVPALGAQGCYGATGAVTRVRRGRQVRVLSGLPSLAIQGGPETQAVGPSDVSFDRRGRLYLTTGLATDPKHRATFGANGRRAARLYRVLAGGRLRAVADLGAFEATVNPDQGQPGTEIDTNPNALVSLRNRHLVVDAGGNSLLRVSEDGCIATLAVFPVGQVAAPPFLGLPPGTMIPLQPVPTSVAVAPDGSYRVGQLVGFPFPPGTARVFRVPRGGGTPTVVAEGFTHISDLAFAADGSLLVLQLATGSLLGPPTPGALVRVAADGTRTTIVSEGLVRPTALAVAANGDVYISNRGTSYGEGEVVRLAAADVTPAP